MAESNVDLASVFEQAESNFELLAGFLASYLQDLMRQGFTREEAFILVRDLHRAKIISVAADDEQMD